MNEVSWPPNRRTSKRSLDLQQSIPNTHRMRRIRSLFWDDDKMYTSIDSKHPKSNESDELISTGVVPCGRLKLRKIHSSPHLYLVDNFLTHKELEHFHSMILAAERRKDFERSFVDEEHSSSEDDIPQKQIILDESITREKANLVERYLVSDDFNDIAVNRMAMTENNHKVVAEIDLCTLKKRKRTKRKLDQHRTSKFIHFSRMASKHIANIESRAADLLYLPHHCVEPIQLVKYIPGQYFNLHHDLGVMTFTEAEDACTHQLEAQLIRDSNSVHISLPPRQNALCPPRRLVTVLVYLNDLPNTCCSCVTKETNIPNSSFCHTPSCNAGFHVTGGSTFFPMLNDGRGLRIIPKQGQALIWCNITKDGLPDKRVIHSGEAINLRRTLEVKDEEIMDANNMPRRITDPVWVDSSIFPIKYALNVWVCEE